MSEQKTTTQAATFLDRSMCLVLNCHYLGNTRSVRMADLEIKKGGETVTTARGALKMTKQLFDGKTLAPVARKFDGMRAWLRAKSAAGHKVFGPSTYFIPYAAFDDVEEGLEQWVKEIADEVELLVAMIPAALEQRRLDLGPMFVESDYPTAAQIREEYSADWNYVSFQPPDHLGDINRAAYDRALAKYNGQLTQAFETVMLDTRQKAYTVMKELANRLGDTKDGRPKGLRDDTALRDLKALVENFPNLNSVAGDDDLAKVMEEIEARAKGLDVATLKTDKELRAALKAFADQAVGTLDGLVVEAERAMSFGGVPVSA